MSNYQPAITKDASGDFYALIVRVDSNGDERVIHGYRGRYFKTLKAAERSTAKHIEKFCS